MYFFLFSAGGVPPFSFNSAYALIPFFSLPSNRNLPDDDATFFDVDCVSGIRSLSPSLFLSLNEQKADYLRRDV